MKDIIFWEDKIINGTHINTAQQKDKFVIYKITNSAVKINGNIHGKIYIGYTGNFNERMYRHRISAENGLTDPNNSDYQVIHKAMNKYGIDNFKVTVIDYAETEREAWDLEILYIKNLKSKDKNIGYNIAPGGQGGFKSTNKPKLVGEKHPLFGRVMSDVVKQRIKDTHKKRGTIKGDTNPCAKLNDEKVLKIIKILENNEFTYKTISKMFDVSESTIKHILKSESWIHIPRSEIILNMQSKKKAASKEEMANRVMKKHGNKCKIFAESIDQTDIQKKQAETKNKNLIKNGYSNGYAKLDEDKVRNIRALFNDKKANVKELSDIYKVTRATIRMSIAGLSWKHVK